MALPKLNTTTYELSLPSTAEKVKYRPFLVKEQKMLMIAQESGEAEQIENAFATIVKECTFEKVDPYTVPMFDVEYIFLQLRSKSVGEKISVEVTCPDDNKTKTQVDINLNEVSIQLEDDHTNVITLTDDVSLVMKYPTLEDMRGFSDLGKVDNIFEMVKRCIFEIHDGDTLHNRVDVSNEELDDFIESMSSENLEGVQNFFETMPKLKHIVQVTNPKTKKKVDIPLEGLQSFFV